MLNSYVDSRIVYSNGMTIKKDKSQTAKHTIEDVILIIQQLKDAQPKVLIASEKDLAEVQNKKISNIITPENIQQNDEIYKRSFLFQYSLPLSNFMIERDYKNASIVRWLKNILRDEKTIIFKDSYILNARGLKVFTKHFLGTDKSTSNECMINISRDKLMRPNEDRFQKIV